MAIVSRLPTKRLDVPDEEGQWVEIRRARWNDLAELNLPADINNAYLNRAKVTKCIVAWSYDLEVTEHNVGEQDDDWFLWLLGHVNNWGGPRSDDEKKGSGSASSGLPTPEAEPQPEPSPPSLATSMNADGSGITD